MQDSSEALLRQCWEERLKGLPQTPPRTSQIEFLVLSPISQVGKQEGQVGEGQDFGGLRLLLSSILGLSFAKLGSPPSSFWRALPTLEAGSGKRARARLLPLPRAPRTTRPG